MKKEEIFFLLFFSLPGSTEKGIWIPFPGLREERERHELMPLTEGRKGYMYVRRGGQTSIFFIRGPHDTFTTDDSDLRLSKASLVSISRV